ncbi:MAG: phosphatase PAP2 family protein [Euryarchaeota archaeon]|nr:phosphatase PAP2 family protein [Euryarchaeota archaeon]
MVHPIHKALPVLLALVLTALPVPQTAAEHNGPCIATDPVNPLLAGGGVVRFTEDPDAGAWTPWWIGPGQVHVAPPPATASATTAEELAELHAWQENRTSFQSFKAALVDSGPAGRFWEDKMLDLVIENSPLPKKNPPRMALMMGLLETAMHDALVISWHYKYCYERPAPYHVDPLLRPLVEERDLPSYPSEHAAVAAAASEILEHFFPDKDVDEDGFTILENGRLAADSRLWGGGNYRSDVEAGFSIGKQVAAYVLAERASDGQDAQWDPSTRPVHHDGSDPDFPANCVYIETPDNGNPPLEPAWGNVDPIWLDSGDQFRVPPPPPCDGPDWMAQTRDLWEAYLNLTDRQKEIADYWEAGELTVLPPGMNLQIAMDKSEEYGLSTMHHVRVLAYVAVAQADVGIAAWDSKYAYWAERPITSVHRYAWDLDPKYDGWWEANTNPTTGEVINRWFPHAVTPQFPGYVSGHASFTGAGQQVLKHLFPEDVPEFRAYQTDAAMARFYGGIHIRSDNDVGVELGIDVGDHIAQRIAEDGYGLAYLK